MPGITGLATTYDLPNFVGELFNASPTDTPFLSSIGGLTGGEAVNAVIFTWEGFDLRDADENRQRLEGAPAPQGEARRRFVARNVVEIHQETVEVSYSKLAATGQFGHTGSPHPGAAGVSGVNPVTNELTWQLTQALAQIARDTEKSFVRGVLQEPSDNTAPRKTQGILSAITTNVLTNATPAPITDQMILDLMQKVWENGGIQVSETATLMCGATQKRRLSTIFITEKNYQEQSRTIGGVNVQTIETDFGRLNLMLNRYMPPDTIAVLSLDECAPRFLSIPGKGFMFAEPLGRVGASERSQLYGEIGLRFGNERTHGKITGLAA